MTALDGILWTDGSTTQQAAEILPWLFVGGKSAASDAMHANSQAFTHVLSTIEPWYADGPNADQITYNGLTNHTAPRRSPHHMRSITALTAVNVQPTSALPSTCSDSQTGNSQTVH